ncbi:hypothetical protein PAECIP112173_01833 [Paenibacillus sp. JJ-100]|nr:hypothetical protein PAECIP112173_01833 [Paenibacillus sp. JJ-100]
MVEIHNNFGKIPRLLFLFMGYEVSKNAQNRTATN